MAKSMAGLKSALETAARGKPVPTAPAATPDKAGAGRGGKIHLGAWLPAGYKTSLRMIQVKTNRSLQELTAEAFNDLFVKYDVPVIGDDGEG